MKCMNCGSSHDVIDFYQGENKIVLCANCRYKMATGQMNSGQIGRPSLGITKKVSVTLSEEDWEWFDKQAEGNRSQFLRYLIGKERSPESRWSNNACLGYAIYGARKLGYTDEQIKKLVRAIYSEFDFKTVNEAKETYNNSPY